MEDELFEELVSQYTPLIKSQIKKYHLTYDYQSFEQLALIALWEAALQYDPTKGSFSSFAYMKIRGKLIDEVRKESKRRNRFVYTDDYESISTRCLPHSEVEISDYLSSLTENQRKWVEHSFIEERSLKDIALLEGVSIEAVKSWRKSALAKLRKIIIKN